MRKSLLVGVAGSSLVVGAAIGAFAFGPVAANPASPVSPVAAQTAGDPTTTVPGGSAATTKPCTPNEDPAHEAGETAEQEAAEANGQCRGHGDHGPGMRGGGSNEDPAHEAGESAEREAEENARQATTPSTTPTTNPAT